MPTPLVGEKHDAKPFGHVNLTLELPEEGEGCSSLTDTYQSIGTLFEQLSTGCCLWYQQYQFNIENPNDGTNQVALG